MSTSFRGPLLHSRAGHPFNGLDLLLAQKAVLSSHQGMSAGNGFPYLGPVAAGSGGGWILSETGSGSVAMNNAGALVLTTATSDEDSEGLQFSGLRFTYSATRNIACFARLKVSTATTTDLMFGLFGQDTTLISASAIAVDDGIGFFKAATATDLTFHVRKTTTSTTQAAGLTIASDAFFVCGFTVIGGAIRMYAAADTTDAILTKDTLLGSGTNIAITNAPAVDLLLTFLAGQEGGTTARAVTVDWAFAAQDI